MNNADLLIQQFSHGDATVGIFGLGYAGLPLACAFAEAGTRTFGFDSDIKKIRKLSQGESYIGHIPSDRIAGLVDKDRLCPQSELVALKECDAAIICVPTPLDVDRNPNLSYVIETARVIRSHLRAGQLVVLESTTYPGTTDEILLPIFADSGMMVGEQFFLAFSPEREDPGNKEFSTRTTPKIVAGVTPKCTAVARALYERIVKKVITVSNVRVAESAKLLENVYRCVNIALVNELKLLFECMGIDVWEVIQAAATKPFGFTPFYPGPGLGGHCVPIDPFYLSWKAEQAGFSTRLIKLAGEINSLMPEKVIYRLTEALQLKGKELKNTKILLLGVAYKKDLDDVRESPALRIIQLLDDQKATIKYHDPHVPHLASRHLDREMFSEPLTEDLLKSCDAAIIVTDHSATDYGLVVRHSPLVVDTRNATAAFRESGQIIAA